MEIENNSGGDYIEILHNAFYDHSYKLDSLLHQVTNSIFPILFSDPRYRDLWFNYSLFGGQKIAYEFAARPVETIIILKVIVTNLDRNIERIKKLDQYLNAEEQKNVIDRLKYFITNCSLFVPDLKSENILNQKDLELIEGIDKRRKYSVPTKTKSYVIQGVFGDYISEYLSKPEQIELFHLITGDSGDNVYNQRFGPALDPTEKTRLDEKIKKLKLSMK
jgi:hypothetical protein